jgi:hypothetical protein
MEGQLSEQCEALEGRKQAVAASLRQPDLSAQQKALLEEEYDDIPHMLILQFDSPS